MPTPRVLLGMTLGAFVATLGALFLGEYEFDELLPILSGALLGLIVAEVVVSVGRVRNIAVALSAAAWSATAVVLAGVLDANETGPIKWGAYLSAGLAAAAALLRANRWRNAPSDDTDDTDGADEADAPSDRDEPTRRPAAGRERPDGWQRPAARVEERPQRRPQPQASRPGARRDDVPRRRAAPPAPPRRRVGSDDAPSRRPTTSGDVRSRRQPPAGDVPPRRRAPSGRQAPSGGARRPSAPAGGDGIPRAVKRRPAPVRDDRPRPPRADPSQPPRITVTTRRRPRNDRDR